MARVRRLGLAFVCFQERAEVSRVLLLLHQLLLVLLLLPPGKSSVAAGAAERLDAEHLDAQVRGDLETHARAVPRQVQQGEHLSTANTHTDNWFNIWF